MSPRITATDTSQSAQNSVLIEHSWYLQVCQWNEETRCNHGYTGPRPDCDNICTVAAVKEFGYEKHTHWPAGSLLISLLSLRIYENEKCSLLTKFVHDSNPGNFTSVRSQ